MSQSQREAFEQNLKSAEEVACTLVYEGEWSLLRPKKQVCYNYILMRRELPSFIFKVVWQVLRLHLTY